MRDLATWVGERAASGCRIIGIDPVTAASVSDQQWIDDSRFMIEAKAAMRQHGASLVLVTHPKKGRKHAVGLDELAGGAAYQRFAQTVLWIEHHKTPKTVSITDLCGTCSSEINRTIHLSKTRNGRGHGLCLGFIFQGDSLRFSEQGVIRISN